LPNRVLPALLKLVWSISRSYEEVGRRLMLSGAEAELLKTLQAPGSRRPELLKGAILLTPSRREPNRAARAVDGRGRLWVKLGPRGCGIHYEGALPECYRCGVVLATPYFGWVCASGLRRHVGKYYCTSSDCVRNYTLPA
jgi:hypothetical protein